MDRENELEFRCPYCSSLLCKYKESEIPFAIEVKCQKRGCGTVNVRGNCVPMDLLELRCEHMDPKKSEKWGVDTICNKLLAKVVANTSCEIKCPRCKQITRNREDI